jgi:hypothetical protein
LYLLGRSRIHIVDLAGDFRIRFLFRQESPHFRLVPEGTPIQDLNHVG